MTVKLANMTVGDLMALVDAKNVDPLKAVQLAKDLRNLMLVLVCV